MMETKEWTFVDKKDWGEGPWQTEPDKVQWEDEETELPCLIVRNGGVTGSLCGYVGVPKGHPWFNMHYGDSGGYGEGVSVHGGLTYSNFCQDDNKETGICHVSDDGIERWWLGFDCSHSGDVSPAMRARLPKYFPALSVDWERYRDVAYVEEQCKNLARQIKEAAPTTGKPVRLITLEDE